MFGTVGIVLQQIPDFPNMVAAEITAGTIGLVGGLSNVLLIRSTGGAVSPKQGIILPLVWALSCIMAVTPLFFTSGTPLKMMVLTFYTFAVAGALGGVATAWVIKSSSPVKASLPSAPSVIIWSLSFGVAAIASSLVGEGLSIIMPAWIAWPVAFETMALIIGIAGGYSILTLSRAAWPARRVSAANNRSSAIPGKNGHPVIILILLCLPFYLNDFSDIAVKDWRAWLLIDYIMVKLIPCLVVYGLIHSKRMDLSEFGLTVPSAASFFSVFLVGALGGVFIEQNGYLIMDKIPGYLALGGMPEITSPLWRWIDLTAGLLLTGISEELVFRGYLRNFLSRYTKRAWIIVLISALAFGLIHWSGGFSKVLVTAAVGAVFMILYLRISSLPAIIIAHFAVNFVDYANLVPNEIFRFF